MEPRRCGAEKKGSKRRSDQTETVLDAIEILPFEPPADATYAVIRANLEKADAESPRTTF